MKKINEFRMWGNLNFKSCKMIYWEEIIKTEFDFAEIIEETNLPNSVYKLMEYTTTKDIEDTKTFDKDIIKTEQGFIGFVYWSNKNYGWMIVYKNGTKIVHDFLCYFKWTVLGNYYENINLAYQLEDCLNDI